MTALTQYARLETVGLWRAAPAGPSREVGVSFGSATLVLTDPDGEPLAHWSLPAVRRLNPGAAPGLFAPDADASETLEIEDDPVVAAIERVHELVARARRAPRRIGKAILAGVAAFGLATTAIWLPGAVRRQALEVMPEAKRSEIGATLLGYLQRDLGVACRDPLGAASLEALRKRVLGAQAPGQVVVLPAGPPEPLALPGDIIVLPEALVEAALEPATVADAILAARAAQPDPLAAVIDRLGLIGTLRMMATGDPPVASVATLATALGAAPPVPSEAALLAVRAAAGLTAAEPPLLLTDGEWVSLQGICRT